MFIGIELEKGFAKKFQTQLKNEIKAVLSRSLPSAMSVIKKRIATAVKFRISSSPDYQQIAATEFRGQLGLPDASVRLEQIVDAWAEGVTVTYVPSTGAGLGSITIGILKSGYEDVLALPAAEFNYTNKKGRSNTLQWLRWLLLEGSQVIIADFDFREQARGSRTGMGIMVKRRGGGWSVPANLSGLEHDNFATRALQEIEADIDLIIRQELTKVIK
jgi:hypothetical protein